MRHPVLRLDFSSGTYQGPDDLHKEVAAQLNALEDEAEVVPRDDDTAPGRFRRLMKVLHERTGQRVAVLVEADSRGTGSARGRSRQPRLSARPVFDREVCRRAHPLQLPHWGEQVFQGQPVFRPQQPEWYTSNDIAHYEGYYASVFYSYFAGLGLDITVEDSSSHGRLDMAVLFNENVYLFEFKVVEMTPEDAAMAQLKAKHYADKYRGLGQPIYLVAVEFSRETRNLAAFDVERA